MTIGPAPDAPLTLVEWRVDGKPKKRGDVDVCRFVPYLDGRDLASLLDQWVGPLNWRDEYTPGELWGDDIMWCTVFVRGPEGEWVGKTDVGKPSEFEPQKGGVSDAFKRAACVKWGAGRNVYSLPTLTAPCWVDGKGRAWPCKETIPSIRRQLKEKGFDDQVVGRVREVDPEDEPASPPARPARKAVGGVRKAPVGDGSGPVSKATRDALNAAYTKLPKDGRTAFTKWMTDQGFEFKSLTELQGKLVIADLTKRVEAAADPPQVGSGVEWADGMLDVMREAIGDLSEEERAQFDAFRAQHQMAEDPGLWTETQVDAVEAWFAVGEEPATAGVS